MSKLTTKHSDIAAWWRKKAINPDGSVTDEPKQGGIRVLIDIGEPSCWACDRPIVSPIEGSGRGWREMWDNGYVTSHLERCHILADSLGGKSEPSNLFLMCKRCHAESPDTKNTSAFFRWVYDKRKSFSMGFMNQMTLQRELNKELERRELPCVEELFTKLPADKQQEFSNLFLNSLYHNYYEMPDPVAEYVNSHITNHWGVINQNSVIIALADCLIHFYQSVVLD